MNKGLFSSENNLVTYDKLNINFSEKKNFHFNKIAVFDDNLLIYDDKLYLFKMDFNEYNANYESELALEDELTDIIFIDINNIFLKLSTGFIKYDQAKNSTHNIKFYKMINNEKEILGEVTSIYFNEKISFKINNKVYYFGLIASSKGELYISSEINENNEDYEITCDLIKIFDEAILKICFKKIINNLQEEFLLVVIFAKNIGYLMLIKFTEDMTTEDLNRELKDSLNWIEIYNQNENIYEIFFSIQFNSLLGCPSSLVIVKDNYKFTYIEFNQDFSIYNDNLIVRTQEIDFKSDLKPGKNKDLIGVHHYNSIVYICCRHTVYVYNYKYKRMIDLWDFDKENIEDLYIIDKQKFYYLIFLTSRNVYFSFMEQKLEDLGFQIRKTIVNFEDAKRGLNRINITNKSCSYCGSDAGYRCSACKTAFYCSDDHQEKDWETHRKTCTFREEDEVQQIEKIEYQSCEYNDKRIEIIKNLKDKKKQKNIFRATDLTYSLIEMNRNNLFRINTNAIKNLKTTSNKDSVFYSNVINLYKMYEDYICNILLLCHTIYLKRNKEETFRSLNKLVREMDEKLEFNKYIDFMCDYLKISLEKQTEREFNSEIETLFLRYLNLVSTIAKLFYKIGEFSSYEMFVVKTVEKIEKIYYNSNSSYILAYTYLIMGNLYVELDSLGKAIQLYSQCLNLLEDPKEKPNIADLYIEANYNLGLLYFVTDQYSLAKNKIDLSIKAKREIKQEEITEQMANFYETLGEIELEYKNHQLSYVNLQKALEIRSKLPNSNDQKSIMKINIMLDFLFQNLEKDIEKKNKTTNQQDKTFMRGEEKDLDDVLSYMKVTNDEKGEFKRKVENNKKSRLEYDIDEMEKFFLLMSKLTPYQLKVLNDTQGDIINNPSMIKLPIVFSSEFKDIISVNQRLEVCNLKLMSLKRDKILKDPYQKIEVENLNYDALYSRNYQNNLTNIKNYFIVNKILKNWENTTKLNGNVNTTQINPSNSSNISNINYYRNSRASVKDTFIPKSSLISQNNLNVNDKNASINQLEKLDKDSKIEYNEFKARIFNYAKEYYNEEVNSELKDEEEILYQIYKELEKEDLGLIMENPEIIFKYIEMTKETEKNKFDLEENNLIRIDPDNYPKLYNEESNRINEEPNEDSLISKNSEKSLKSKVEPGSIIDTSNVNDEKNNDKSHRLHNEKVEKLKNMMEEIPKNEEKKQIKDDKNEEKMNNRTLSDDGKDRILDKPMGDRPVEESKVKPNKNTFSPNIPKNVKDILMKQMAPKSPVNNS